MHEIIRRVSHLFIDHPSLITGFSAFLPPGFEVKVNGRVITISEPNRVTKFCIGRDTDVLAQRALALPSKRTDTRDPSALFATRGRRARHRSHWISGTILDAETHYCQPGKQLDANILIAAFRPMVQLVRKLATNQLLD